MKKNTKGVFGMFGLIVCLVVCLVGESVEAQAPPGGVWTAVQFGGVWSTANADPMFSNTSTYTTGGITCSTVDRYGLGQGIIEEMQTWLGVDKGSWMKVTVGADGKWSAKSYLKIFVHPGGYSNGSLEFSVTLTESSRDPNTGKIQFTGTWILLNATGYCAGWSGNGKIQASGTYAHQGGKNPEEIHFPQMKIYPEFRGGLRLTGYTVRPVTE